MMGIVSLCECLVVVAYFRVQLLFALRILVNLPGGFWAFLALLYSYADIELFSSCLSVSL